MREKAVLFGPERSLVGVWTEVRAEARASAVRGAVPAVIIINSGLVPHTGIWRLHVRLARALAQRGFPSLRFDLSGIGDSGAPREGLPLAESVRRDIDAAVAYARDTQGMERIVTLGLCSGAHDAIEAAGRHDDVVGLVAIDLISDLTIWQFYAVHFGSRLLKLQSWKNTLLGRNGRVKSLLGMLPSAGSPPANDHEVQMLDMGVRPLLSRGELKARLSPLAVRGTRLLFVFSGGLEDNYNHRGQFRTAMPELSRAPELSVDFFPDANHTFEDAEQQRALVARVAAWCSEGFSQPQG